MSFLRNVLNALSEKIGEVVDGSYKGVQIGWGQRLTPSGAVAKPKEDVLIFFTKPNDYRFNNKEIESFEIESRTPEGTTYNIHFKDGKRSTILIKLRENIVNSILIG